MTRQTFIQYLEWLGGSINPISHPGYPSTAKNEVLAHFDYFLNLRKKIYQENGQALINIIANLLTHPLTPSEIQQLHINIDDFQFEFFELLAIFKNTPEGDFLLEKLHHTLLKITYKNFHLEALSYLHNSKSISYLQQLSPNQLNEEALISLVCALGEIRGQIAYNYLLKLMDLKIIQQSPLVLQELEIARIQIRSTLSGTK